MAKTITPVVKKAVDLKTLGPVVATVQGSPIVSNLSSVVNKDGTTSQVPTSYSVVRNNRIIGICSDPIVARDLANYTAQREQEFGTDI